MQDRGIASHTHECMFAAVSIMLLCMQTDTEMNLDKGWA